MHNATIRSAFSNSNQLSQQELQTYRIKAKEQVDTEHVQVLFVRDLQNRAQRRALLWQSSAPLVLTQNYQRILWREASHPSVKIPIISYWVPTEHHFSAFGFFFHWRYSQGFPGNHYIRVWNPRHAATSAMTQAKPVKLKSVQALTCKPRCSTKGVLLDQLH